MLTAASATLNADLEKKSSLQAEIEKETATANLSQIRNVTGTLTPGPRSRLIGKLMQLEKDFATITAEKEADPTSTVLRIRTLAKSINALDGEAGGERILDQISDSHPNTIHINE